jgi:DNA-binding NarL/FixJ family response regulator
VHVFVIERHPIYRRGLAECLRALASVESVTESEAVGAARVHADFPDAGLVILDQDLPGAGDLLRELGDSSTTEAIVLLSRGDGDVLEAVEAGAAGFLSRDTLTPATLAATVEAAGHGTRVIAPTLLNGLARRRASGARAALRGTEGGPDSWLTSREQQVLSLIADGHPTREVAKRLSYSERTVKNVLHDVVTKLGARSRSQAVAHAVRDGLI